MRRWLRLRKCGCHIVWHTRLWICILCKNGVYTQKTFVLRMQRKFFFFLHFHSFSCFVSSCHCTHLICLLERRRILCFHSYCVCLSGSLCLSVRIFFFFHIFYFYFCSIILFSFLIDFIILSQVK